MLLNLTREVALVLTSDLFDVLLLLPCGTKSDFLEEAMTFLEKPLPLQGTKSWQNLQR
jgi:hypothetical protein